MRQKLRAQLRRQKAREARFWHNSSSGVFWFGRGIEVPLTRGQRKIYGLTKAKIDAVMMQVYAQGGNPTHIISR